MPRYEIKASDGRPYEIEAVDDAEAQRLESFINDRLAAGDTDPANWKPDNAVIKMPTQAERLNQTREKLDGKGGYKDLIQQGVTFGLSDELAGVVNAAMHPLTSGSYEAGRDAERTRLEQARQNTGWTGTLAEIGGSLLGGIPRAGMSALLSAGQTLRTASATGAAGGAVGGFGSGDGTLDSLIKAGVGAALGGVIGGAAPVVTNIAANRIGGLSRMFGRDTENLSRQIVGEAITADSSTPAAVGQRLVDASQRGVPLAIADTGENARGLLASVSRQPGPARQLARESVGQRQVEQGDRIVGAINRDLGPVSNVRRQSEALMDQARTASRPLYEEAFGRPALASDELNTLLATPAGKAALNKARTIALNERRDPNKLGFDFDDDGNAALISSPSFETLDYIKKGLDDILEDARDPVTRQIQYTPSLRSVENVRQSLIAEVDRLNPVYAEARAAFAGPASAEEALQLGRKMVNASGDEIEAAVSRMSAAEREQFALGHRAALADDLGRAVDGSDKVGRLLGTPRKRDALNAVHGDRLPSVQEGFKNVVHDRPALQVGRANPADHVTENGFTYRSLSPAEIESAEVTNGFLPNPSGRSSGGRTNVKHWVRGGDESGQFFRDGQLVVRARNEAVIPSQPVATSNVEVWRGGDVWEPLESRGPGFKNFLQTMADERATNETYRSVMTGSQTAERLAADAQTVDGGLAETAMSVATRGGTTALGLFGDALKALREVDRFGAGEAGNRTRESVAALLTQTDPAVLAELSRSVNRALARQRGQASRINNVTGRLGTGLGSNTGQFAGSIGSPD